MSRDHDRVRAGSCRQRLERIGDLSREAGIRKAPFLEHDVPDVKHVRSEKVDGQVAIGVGAWDVDDADVLAVEPYRTRVAHHQRRHGRGLEWPRSETRTRGEAFHGSLMGGDDRIRSERLVSAGVIAVEVRVHDTHYVGRTSAGLDQSVADCGGEVIDSGVGEKDSIRADRGDGVDLGLRIRRPDQEDRSANRLDRDVPGRGFLGGDRWGSHQ